jgi:hypothetical protein
VISRHLFGAWLDGSSARLRELLGELEGVSEETLQRIDHVSRPSGDGPVPRYPEDVMLYERLVMLAFAEHLACAEAAREKPRSPASSARRKAG